jgi:hypothetical protein
MSKRFVAVALGIVLVVGGVSCTLFAIRAHQRHVQEAARLEADRRLAWKLVNAKALLSLSKVASFTEEEQFRLDRAADDPEKLQPVLLAIHKERFGYWNKQYENLSSHFYHILGIEELGASVSLTYAQLAPVRGLMEGMDKAHTEADRYRLACKSIESWQPSDLAAFKQSEEKLSSPQNAPSPEQVSAHEEVPASVASDKPDPADEPIAYNTFYAKVRAGTLPVGKRYAFRSSITDYQKQLFLTNPDYPNSPLMQLTARASFEDPSAFERLLSSGVEIVHVIASANEDGTVNVYSAQ